MSWWLSLSELGATWLNAVLRAFNSSRHGATRWARLVDRLAQVTFRASEHLIVYGSLSPGGPNHGRLAVLGGMWETGWVEGQLDEVGWGAKLGFPALHWRPGWPQVPAHLLRWTALRDHWEELDQFEGAGYQRVLVPFHSDGGSRTVCYLYAAASPDRGAG